MFTGYGSTIWTENFKCQLKVRNILTLSLNSHRPTRTLNGNTPPTLLSASNDVDPATGTASLLREYLWTNGEPVAVVDGATDAVYFIRTDHIGRPLFATDVTGVKVWEASYLPFGGVRVSSGDAIVLRFPGQWFQSESGLHQNWMRDYDPTTGRYIQADPLGLVDGASVYGYALQNPGRYVDPRGEQAIPPSGPNGVVPGGPWTPAGPGQKPFTFFGPKPESGRRTMCRYVPDTKNGGPPGAKNGYWKTQSNGQKGWQRFDLNGNPQTAEQAHPRLPLPRPVFPLIMFTDPSFFIRCEKCQGI